MAQPDRRRIRAQRRRRLRRATTATAGRSACGISTAEKTFQTYFFTTRNPGGHSSRPRPDNAIYELADALKALQAHRFRRCSTTRPAAISRAGQAGRRQRRSARRCGAWLANPQRRRRRRRDRGQSAGGRPDPHPLRRDDAGGRPCRQCAAADAPRRRSIAGSCPGVDPKTVQAELQQLAGAEGRSDPRSQLHRRADAGLAACAPTSLKAVTAAIAALPRAGDASHSVDVDRGERRQLLPRRRNPGLRHRRQLGHLARRRARPRPRRAAAGARHVRQRAPLGDAC